MSRASESFARGVAMRYVTSRHVIGALPWQETHQDLTHPSVGPGRYCRHHVPPNFYCYYYLPRTTTYNNNNNNNTREIQAGVLQRSW
jgi:hypothetical protein